MTKRKSTTFLNILELEVHQTNNLVENDSSVDAVDKSIRESDSTPKRMSKGSSKEVVEKKESPEQYPFDESLLINSSCSNSSLSGDDESEY